MAISARQVGWHVELEIATGAVDEFLALTVAMIEAARAEPGCVSYERFVAGTVVDVFEVYTDASAAEEHLRFFAATFGDRFSELVTRRHFHLYGDTTDAVERLAGTYGAQLITRIEAPA